MTQINNEAESIDSPVISDDTKATMDYFKAQGNSFEEPVEAKPEESVATPEPVKAEDKPEEPKEEVKTDELKPNRTPKVMPVWQHEVELKKIEKQHQQELEDARKAAQETFKKNDEPDSAISVSDKIKQVADEFGVDENVLAKIVDLAKPEIPAEFREAAKELNAIKQERLQQQEELGFDKEFNNVLPLIVQEYGELDASQLSEIKTKLKDIAFQEQFAKTPLNVIYKGFDDFRNTKVIKRTMEPTRMAPNTDSSPDFSGMTDEDLAKADRDTQAKYFAWADQKNQKR